jgi:hypothetical protein
MGHGDGDEQIDLIVQAPIGQGKTPNFAILYKNKKRRSI